MIELTIKGETAEELLNQAAPLLAVLGAHLLHMHHMTSFEHMAPASEEPQPETVAEPQPETTKKQRGRKKTETVPEAQEPKQLDIVEDTSLKNDGMDVPSSLVRTVEFTLDKDIRPRVRAVITKKTAALKAEGETDTGAIAAKATDFVVDTFFSKFGISKISELSPAKYADFMAATEEFA